MKFFLIIHLEEKKKRRWTSCEHLKTKKFDSHVSKLLISLGQFRSLSHDPLSDKNQNGKFPPIDVSLDLFSGVKCSQQFQFPTRTSHKPQKTIFILFHYQLLLARQWTWVMMLLMRYKILRLWSWREEWKLEKDAL